MVDERAVDADASPLGADAAPVDVVHAWLAASNAGDADQLIALTAPDVEIIGPRGAERGRDVLRAWMVRGAAQFRTERAFSAGERVVVEQLGIGRTPDGQVRGQARVSSRFVVRAGRVALVQRYDNLDEALAQAEISPPELTQRGAPRWRALERRMGIPARVASSM